jgi:hypothetical protein
MSHGNDGLDNVPEEAVVPILRRENHGLKRDLAGHKRKTHERFEKLEANVQSVLLWRARIKGGMAVYAMLGSALGALFFWGLSRMFP